MIVVKVSPHPLYFSRSHNEIIEITKKKERTCQENQKFHPTCRNLHGIGKFPVAAAPGRGRPLRTVVTSANIQI